MPWGASDNVTTYMLVTRFCRQLQAELALNFRSVSMSIFRELYGVFRRLLWIMLRICICLPINRDLIVMNRGEPSFVIAAGV